MKYIKNRNIYKINEGWLDEKLKSIDSDIMKAIITNLAKPFSKWSSTFKDKWSTIKPDDISYQFLENLNLAFSFIYGEIDKITNPDELLDILDNLSSTFILIKDDLNKVLIKDLGQTPNINGLKSILDDLFSKVDEGIEALTDDYNTKLGEEDLLDSKKRESVTIIKNMFKNIESEINSEDYSKMLEDNKDNSTMFKVGDVVKYKKEEYIDNKSPNEQPENVAEGEVMEINGDIVLIKNKNIGKDIEKNISDILIFKEDKAKKQEELKTELGKLKDDPKKLSKVLDFVKELK